jgi:hypothetical protein
MIPQDVNIADYSQEILENLPAIIHEILDQHSDDRLWTVIQRRFGLEATVELTLEEIGIAFGLTRERVRQLEEMALKELREALIEGQYISKNYQVRPQVAKTARMLSQIALDQAEKAVRESVLLHRIKARFDISLFSIKPSIYLLLELSGIERIDFDKSDLESIWGILETKVKGKIQRSVEKLDRLLTRETVTPLAKIDILIYLNKSVRKDDRLSLEELDAFLELCSSVTEYSNGFYWGKFQHLVGRANQVERILSEQGETTHIKELTRELNHRLVKHGKSPVNPRNLRNQMSTDNRFVPIGRSGEWGLSDWALNTETIVELIRQCLRTRNQPSTADEIYAYVKERRPASNKSICTYLSSVDDFAKVNATQWGLASWAEAESAQVWNPKQVGTFVSRIFQKNKAKKIEYSIVKEALIDEASVSANQAQGMLNVNPVIQTQQDSKTGILYAIYQPDYEKDLLDIGERLKPKKSTLRQKVAKTTRAILAEAPGQQIALYEVVNRLEETYKRSRKTFYRYISDLDFVEKFTVPDVGKTMCRLKPDRKTKTPFGQVKHIRSPNLRDNVARSLSFLNVSDVDIALFLLSKEFEATLRKYLKLGYKQGALRYLPKGGLSLSVMIDFVEKEKIITDKAVLHFLRQKRNDRAHGPTPSLEERRIMMKQAEVTAGMYIDYIEFFDNLSHDLI